jgi:homoserine O-acetyltransferase
MTFRSVLLFWLALPAFAQQFASLGDFRLESGEVIHDCRIGYRTLGKLNDEKSNAILVPSWFTGSSENLVGLIGANGIADPARFFVILVDALGNGVSSSPSNSKQQPRMKFPKFTIRDMVNSEYRLVTETFHLNHLHAVMGISMGGMQTFQWIVAYPDFVSRAVPIVGSPRLTAYDLLLWESEAHAIEDSKDWNGGDYTKRPDMRVAAEIHNLALTTPAYRVRETKPDAFPGYLKKLDADGLARMDANDWLRQLEAMISLNAATPSVVRAKVLVVASDQDHMVNPTPAVEFAETIHAPVIHLKGDCGHLANGCESAGFYGKVREFLEK